MFPMLISLCPSHQLLLVLTTTKILLQYKMRMEVTDYKLGRGTELKQDEVRPIGPEIFLHDIDLPVGLFLNMGSMEEGGVWSERGGELQAPTYTILTPLPIVD